MKRMLLSAIVLTFCLCTYGQKKIKFEYDSSGNLVKRYVPIEYETAFFGDYTLKVNPSPTKGPLHIQVLDGRSQQVLDNVRIQIIVCPTVGSGPGVELTVKKGDVNVDISNPYYYPNGIYAVVALVFKDDRSAPAQGSVKIIKK